LPLKNRIFDPLLPKRLAEFGIASNTPCVPEGTVADIYIYRERIWARDINPLFNRALILKSARYHPHGKTRSPNTAGPDLARYQEA